jgi:hypothetical protein
MLDGRNNLFLSLSLSMPIGQLSPYEDDMSPSF